MIGGKLAANGANHGQLRPLAAVRLDLFAHGKKRRTSVAIPSKNRTDVVPNGAVTGPTGDPVEHILQLVRALTETAAEVRG